MLVYSTDELLHGKPGPKAERNLARAFPQQVMKEVASFREYVFFGRNVVLLDFGDEICDHFCICGKGLVTSPGKCEWESA